MNDEIAKEQLKTIRIAVLIFGIVCHIIAIVCLCVFTYIAFVNWDALGIPLSGFGWLFMSLWMYKLSITF